MPKRGDKAIIQNFKAKFGFLQTQKQQEVVNAVRFSISKALQLAGMICSLLCICTAQIATVKPLEPESIGTFFYLDSAAQTLKQLPKEEFKKHRGGSFSTVTDSVMVSGDASALHIPSNDATTFVFKVFKDEEAARAKLFQFNVKGSEREYELGRWKRRDYTANGGLSVNVAKFGESSYKLTPETPLSPGEYALTLGPSVFTFSVR
jgi:hypothetical protein